MSRNHNYRLQLAAFRGSAGALHMTTFSPVVGSGDHWVIHVPAFGEEMNKSRAMVAEQARALAQLGHVVLVPDHYGTGESEGEFEDATWEIWHADLLELLRLARVQGATNVTLWGHRLGCLLAASVAAAAPEAPDRVLMWQPVYSGRQHLAQFLRLRMAASLSSKSATMETVASLRSRLESGETLEVAGYRLSSCLYQQVAAQEMGEFVLPGQTPLQVIEVLAGPGAPLTPVTQRQVEQWCSLGMSCRAAGVPGEPFWTTQERATAPDLIASTIACLGGSASGVRDSDQSHSPIDPCRLSYGLAADARPDWRYVVFYCDSEPLAGVIHDAGNEPEVAVVIVVGGPQYRVGSHRQFVSLARALSAVGLPAMRFDYRGMGDSGGAFRGFTGVSEDIRSAIDALQQALPSVKSVVLWGLCDAATAAMCYAPGDPRIAGLVLANPWVYSERGSAKAYLRHYYLRRLLSRGFWRKVRAGEINASESLTSAWQIARNAFRPGRSQDEQSLVDESVRDINEDQLPDEFASSLARYPGRTCFILSGNDLTAAEFLDASTSNPGLKRAMQRSNVRAVHLPGMDHTFSRHEWQDRAERETAAFIADIGTP